MRSSREDLRLALVVAKEIRFTIVVDKIEHYAVRSSIRGRPCTIVTRLEGEGGGRRVTVEDFHWGLPDQAAVEAGLLAAGGS